MEPKKAKILTKYHTSLLDGNKCSKAYVNLRDNISWEEGIRSRSGFTRLAKALNIGENKLVDELLTEVLNKLSLEGKYDIFGIYLNYYKDGTYYTPPHSHKDTEQLIISLGATRILRIGSKDYTLGNGDVIIFGSSAHGISKDISILQGRISIATFMRPVNSVRPINSMRPMNNYNTEEELLQLVLQQSLKEY